MMGCEIMRIKKWLFHFGGTYLLPPSLGNYHGIFFNTAVREGDFVDLCLFTHPSWMVTYCLCVPPTPSYLPYFVTHVSLFTYLSSCLLPAYLPVFLTASPPFLRFSFILANIYCSIKETCRRWI